MGVSHCLYHTLSRMTQFTTTRGGGKPIRNAGCLIIGDEILNGKILDTNSYNFARFCFNNLSIPLKRTIVCGDDEQDIINSLNILLKQDKLDLIITSGGLGSTHDDITYKVISDYFQLDYQLDQEVVDRMKSIRGEYLDKLNPEQLNAFYRMATLPAPPQISNPKSNSTTTTIVEKYFIDDKLWFPIVGLNEQVYILPGVPQLFTQLIKDMEPMLKPRVISSDLIRRYVVTKSGETQLAPFLTNLQEKCDKKYGKGILKLGSYPHMNLHINTISIIGQKLNNEDLDWIVQALIENIGGDAKEITQAQEDEYSK
ncbi:molybdopterin binding protein, putative [Candida dubliniensis CD36]|uniref:Molybdopterin binding protein, putative n=1 Tax=Candida dubliniensis (strain CD36 / ATCC MYA-646 / CBS 7987 / NCPF 3949 / NRRL Y-17841) TaxID=573826 RepID=B9WJ83_CANDC|nr:molybdopterin binding protein, putative [Candida dubliniensis CD36]CAX41304.1 molybdopterin binding protein, putative [Candida dubliniensis CD36]